MSDQENWIELCRAAMIEKDPDKLLSLAEELTRLLEQREETLRGKRSASSEAGTSRTRRAEPGL